jgi:hypothetical protein
MQLVSYKEAVAKGLSKYFTGKPCKKGHIAERRVSGRCCSLCASETAIKWAKNNPNRSKEIITQWNERNKDREALRAREWRKNNPETYKRMVKEWREKNAVTYKAYMTLQAVKRNTAKLKRTPSWLNSGHLFEIESVYNYCSSLRRLGLNYHVDHVVPLQGESVSGLHVPWNLQVIPGAENMSKSNKFVGGA